jgi:putative ABC transport system permease protein
MQAMARSFLKLNTLNRKLLRDLWKSKGQAIAVTAVILCGIGDYVAVSSAYRNLKLTRDTYYHEYRLADFWIPLERAPKSAVYKVEAIKGVTRARGRVVKDVNLDVAGSDDPKIGRIVSMPDKPRPVLNDFCLVSGRYFASEALDEVILSDRFAKANKLRVGDRIRATINNRKEALRIVGTALSPEYVYMIRNAQEFIPNDLGFGVLFVKDTFAEMILDMRDGCNEIVGSVDSPDRLDAVFERAKKILEPYGVLATIKQRDQISNRFISDEIAGLGVAAKIDPSIFMGVAAMILTLMLARMVKRERTEIGLLKAYGYTDLAITGHYLKFAWLVALAGWLGGIAVGGWLGRWMIGMYQQFYQYPLLRYRFYGDVMGLSLGIAVTAGSLGATVAVVRVLRISPAESMRPEAPRLGGAILLERIGWFWRRVSFTWKMILRNTARYKVRAGVSIFGVAMATAILLLGRFIVDSMDRLMHHQFREVQLQDVKVTFESERGQQAIGDLRRIDHVRKVEPLFEYPFEVHAGWRKKELLVTGLRPDTQMFRLMDTEGRPVELTENGLVLTERTAHEMGLRGGDQVILKPMIGKVKKERTVAIRPPIRQYLGMGAYMNLDALSRLMDENLAVNAALLRVDRGSERALTRRLKQIPGVAGVEIKETSLVSFEKTLKASMGIMNTILLTFAGVIAFAIIYNATSITILERSRELASLRVLGFSLDEVGRIVFRENWLLSAIGVAVGLPLGLGLCRWISSLYSTDLYRLPFFIRNETYVFAVLSIAVFVALANWSSRRRIRSLDMVEVLKSRE